MGLVSEDLFAGGPNYRTCNLNRQRAAGVDLIRQAFDWAAIERRRGRYRFAHYDAYVGALARYRIRVLPILVDPPSFRSSRPRSGARRGIYPPRRYSDIGRFGAVLVRRYGPRGSFWRSHRSLPRMAIRSWQIWNEPSVRFYWPPGPSPRSYTRLLRAARRGIRSADPRAEIVTAGVPDSRLAVVSYSRFISGMYRAGGRRAFDTLAIHPYAPSARRAVRLVRSARRLMNRYGDRRGRLWVTEIGWATSGPMSRMRTSRTGQARRIGAFLRSCYRERRQLRLRGVVYYNWHDLKPYPPLFLDFFGLHTGLLDPGDRAKPSLRSFGRAARRMR